MRHAHSVGNEDHSLYITSQDHLLGLSQTGLQQCTERWADEKYRYILNSVINKKYIVYCSPFERTKQTLRNTILQDDSPTKIKYDIRLREHSFGKPQSLPELEQTADNYYGDMLYYASDCGEQGLQTFDRVQSFLDSVNTQLYEDVVIITHGALMNVFDTIFTGMNLEQHSLKHFPKNLEIRVYEEVEL
jgi:broad specificity phosphatase PhoE